MAVSVDTLVAQAQKLYQEADDSQKGAVAISLLPSADQWDAALLPLLNQAPDPALAVTNPLCSVMGLLDSLTTTSLDDTSPHIPRDADGFSSAIRLASYSTRLIRAADIKKYWSEDEMVLLYSKLELVQTLANDHLSIERPDTLWDTLRADTETHILDRVLEIQTICASWEQEKAQFVTVALQKFLDRCIGCSIASYYNARVYSAATSQLRELHGNVHIDSDELVSSIRESRETDSILHTMAILTSIERSKEMTKYANELLAHLTDLDFYENTTQGKFSAHLLTYRHMLSLTGWQSLLYFNAITDKEETIVVDIPKPRLVFFIKALVKTLSGMTPVPVRSEILRALNTVLPCIKDTYETFWGDILELLPVMWSSLESGSDENIPLIYTSLRLLSTLRKVVTQGSNDDLEESWRDNDGPISDSLIRLMRQLQGH